MAELLNLILLVDDDETTNHVNKRLISKLNVAKDIITFTNGKEALDYLKEAAKPNKPSGLIYPDLIFMDIRMPVMDGFEFMKAYEAENLASQNPVIIMMLTSSASFYDLERLKDYKDVKRHLSKTLTTNDVQELIREYFPDL